MSPYQGNLKLQEFKASIPDQDLKDFEALLSLSKIGPETFENTSGDAAYGLSHSWVVKAKDRWLNGYDWYVIYHTSEVFESDGISAESMT
jgi:microsomal epoxide hydrolase